MLHATGKTMMSGPLVSVVMPTLNQRQFIAASIDSVLDQGYSLTELIVADGGSTDGTLELLQQRASADQRVRWLSREDGGPAEALNRALALVRGTIVGWLNSDDLYVPGAIERAVTAFAAHPDWLMVYGRGQHIDGGGAVIGPYPTLLPDGPIERFASGCFVCQPTVFFKKTMHTLLGDLDQQLGASFDFDYWLRAFAAFSERIGFVDELQAQSRLHTGCITLKMRKRVAVEGVRVVARHLGEAPAHWLATYIEETLAASSERPDDPVKRDDVLSTLDELRHCLAPEDYETMKRLVAADSRFE